MAGSNKTGEKEKPKPTPTMSALSAILNPQSGRPTAAGEKTTKRVFIYSGNPNGHTLALEQRPINGTFTELRGKAVQGEEPADTPVLKYPSSMVTLLWDDMVSSRPHTNMLGGFPLTRLG